MKQMAGLPPFMGCNYHLSSSPTDDFDGNVYICLPYLEVVGNMMEI
jgi:hypothetical protein